MREGDGAGERVVHNPPHQIRFGRILDSLGGDGAHPRIPTLGRAPIKVWAGPGRAREPCISGHPRITKSNKIMEFTGLHPILVIFT